MPLARRSAHVLQLCAAALLFTVSCTSAVPSPHGPPVADRNPQPSTPPGSSAGTDQPPETPASPLLPDSLVPDSLDGYPFGPQSIWRTEISSAPTAQNSADLVAHLGGTVADRYGGVAAFNVYRYNNSFYVTSEDTPRVDLAFDDCQGKGYLPQVLTGAGGQFTDVPIPADAVPSPGTDQALSIYSPETDQLWEFWRVEHAGGPDWSACWGGRIDDVSTSSGFFGDGFGATGTGLASSGGMVRLADVRAGVIQHAMSLAIPNPAVRTNYSWPAQRSDGFDVHPHAVPEGTRLRLDPSVDVRGLGLHPVAEMIAIAAQQYGFIVVDTAGAVAVIAESGGPEETATGVDPWAGLLAGTLDYRMMAGFPWDRLQALPKDYGKP